MSFSKCADSDCVDEESMQAFLGSARVSFLINDLRSNLSSDDTIKKLDHVINKKLVLHLDAMRQ